MANGGDKAVSELDASTGSLIKVISGARFQFDSPDAIVSNGAHVWETNYKDQTVTELDAITGGLVRVITEASGPDAVAADRVHVWVGNYFGQSVTSLPADH